MTRAFVIGNGESRQGFPLEVLENEVTFGCNALYRDWWPTYLVAIDNGMIQEIEQSDFPRNRVIDVPETEKWEPVEVNPNRPRSNAGINAMREAIKRGYTDIRCLGFDFVLRDKESSTSNLYDGTENYGPWTRARYEDNPNRAVYLRWVVEKNPEVRFTFCFPAVTPFDVINEVLDIPGIRFQGFSNLGKDIESWNS